jgi:hypothetical protein
LSVITKFISDKYQNGIKHQMTCTLNNHNKIQDFEQKF